jgi:hypothetical protein
VERLVKWRAKFVNTEENMYMEIVYSCTDFLNILGILYRRGEPGLRSKDLAVLVVQSVVETMDLEENMAT